MTVLTRSTGRVNRPEHKGDYSMRQVTRFPSRWSARSSARKLLGFAGLGGGGVTLAGCVAAAGVAGAVAVALLTGLFLSRIQASFAATAHSYAYSDAGDVRFLFHATEQRTPSLVTMVGRLPGFHMVIITGPDKAMVSAQDANGDDQPDIFETDVEIDFGRSPPTVTGTIRERDGDGVFPLDELYPEIDSPTLEVRPSQTVGSYEIRLNIRARNADGDQLDYALVMDVGLSADGLRLSGNVNVERTLTPAGGSPLETVGTGEVEGRKQTGDQPQTPDEPATEDNGDEGGAQDENDNADDLNDNGDELNDNGDELNDNGDVLNDNAVPDNENASGPDNDNVADEGPITSDDCPDLPQTAISFLNDLLADIGLGAFDLDGDGAASADEVHQVIDPIIALTDEEIVCIVRVVNG